MHEILNKIHEYTAEKILFATGQEHSIPVDLNIIIHYLGIKKVPADFFEIEKKENMTVYGLILLNNADVGLFYRKKDSIEQKRYVISHEIGHCCLHSEQFIDGYIELLTEGSKSKERENQADIFAMNLLMPEDSIKSVHSRLIKPSVQTIAAIFQVPVKFAKRRLDLLKITYFDVRENRMVVPN